MSGSAPRGKIPNCDEFEITVLGAGYGESIVIHLGHNEWVIVDCTKHRGTSEPSPLKYLRSIGVEVSTCVKAIVATHWHDDHIRGLSKLVEECSSAKFFMSAAFVSAPNKDQFLKLIFDSPISRLANIASHSQTGVAEFKSTLEQLKDSDRHPYYAINDQLLHQFSMGEMWSLSPDSTMFQKSIQSILDLIPSDTKPVKRLSKPTPNLTSVVLWLKFNGLRCLLGADLEEHPTHKGWSIVINNKKPAIVDTKAAIYKVAHHGSVTGHHPKIWTDLLEENPICIIAPFNRNPKLPQEADIERIKDSSNAAYLTASSNEVFVKSEEKAVNRKLQQREAVFAEAKFSYVSIRINAQNETDIVLHGDATALTKTAA